MTGAIVFDGPTADAVFVPAIMSAGLLFSIITVIRDLLHHRFRPGRQRRVSIAAISTARFTDTGEPAAEAVSVALRPRSTYFLIGASALAAAVYIAIGALANFNRPNGYVSDIGWLLAVSAISAVLLLNIAAVGIGLFVTWPHPPYWLTRVLVASPLGHDPAAEADRTHRRFLLGWGAMVTGVCSGILTLGIATANPTFARQDGRLSDMVQGAPLIDDLAWVDVLGTTEVAVALALLVGVATLRCVPFALVYVTSVALTLGADAAVKWAIDRPRPPGTSLSALTDSYPSGHVAQVVLIAGFVPLALEVLTDLRWHTHLVGGVLVAAVVAAGLTRVNEGLHWPTDVVGGAALGAAVALGGHWVLEHPRWHPRCHTCPWVPHEHRPLGAIHVTPRTAERLREVALAWSALAIVGFAIAGVTRGIPRNPDNDLLGVDIETPLSLVALGILVVGWTIALHWNGAGAVALVVGGALLAVLSSVAFHPSFAVAILTIFLLPAAALWLAWQHDQTRRMLTILGGVTAALVIGVYSASGAVYGHFFGPQHPQSATPALPVDAVDWLVAGAVRPDGFEVHAKMVDGVAEATLVVAGIGSEDEAARTPSAQVPESGIVTLRVDGLDPSTSYTYRVVADGVPDTSRGQGTIRTTTSGPTDLRVVVSSCAQTGSNGRVFDAIRALDPDLYLVTGDLHYGNPDRADPDLFRRNFARVFSAPAQAELFRSVPFAYVWDDHDYGPNDADGSSPTRDTARAAYREAIPNTAELEGPIHQAFTLGRVRFLLTDTRSARSPDSMLGDTQLAWLVDELRTASATHALVVWVNPDPWVAPGDADRDDWGAYPQDRATLLDAIESAAIDNLVMLSGDAHMVAVDDGTNTGGFPLLHAAALDRPGTVKGGPYSHGTYPGAGQFGVLEVRDDGGARIEVELSGQNWRGEELVAYSFTVDVPSTEDID